MTKIEGFGDRVKYLLDSKFNGNRSLFARTIGISEARLRSYEDSVTPGADIIITMAKVLEISCEWLLLGTESKGTYSENEDIEVLIEYLREKDRKIESLIESNTILKTQLKTKKKTK